MIFEGELSGCTKPWAGVGRNGSEAIYMFDRISEEEGEDRGNLQIFLDESKFWLHRGENTQELTVPRKQHRLAWKLGSGTRSLIPQFRHSFMGSTENGGNDEFLHKRNFKKSCKISF